MLKPLAENEGRKFYKIDYMPTVPISGTELLAVIGSGRLQGLGLGHHQHP